MLDTADREIRNGRAALTAATATAPLSDTVRRAAHRLASSGGILGLSGLIAAARAAEQAAATGDRAGLAKAVEATVETTSAALAAIEGWRETSRQSGPTL